MFNYMMITLFFSFAVLGSVKEQIESTLKLRQEVETLATEVETLKKTNQAEIDVYIQRSQEVEGQILRENFKLKQIKDHIQLSKQKIKVSTSKEIKAHDQLFLISFWEKYTQSLKLANPVFSARLEEKLQKIKIDFKDHKLSYEQALLQTWYILDSDIKKSQDTEFHLTPLTLNKESFHVEMVRLGRSKGLVRTAEGQYAVFEVQPSKIWGLTAIKNKDEQKWVEEILTQFKAQQKMGLFRLPPQTYSKLLSKELL